MKEELINIRNQALNEIMSAKNKSDLEQLRVSYLGRKGRINKAIQNLKELTPEIKKTIGPVINETKKTLELEIKARQQELQKTPSSFDPTVPAKAIEIGSLHLTTQAIREIETIFKKLGYTRRRYPEVEWDYYAFSALNFGPNHPARDEWETFFIDKPIHKKYGQMLLTPHTSSGQVREMLSSEPPIKMINISKCYRRQSDARHYPMFHQFEGLLVDKNISIIDLKGTLDYFAESFFGKGRKTRIRPYNFPFTEPSFEVDINCGFCLGKGSVNGKKCKICKEGWHEIGGAGMVHPNVLRAGKIDPNKYSGFAFGWGVERVFLMKQNLGIDDLRTFYSSQLHYLKQF